METCIRMGLPDEPLLGALGTNPYWARNWLLFGQETKPVPGADEKVDQIKGKQQTRLSGDNVGEYRKRVKRIQGDSS